MAVAHRRLESLQPFESEEAGETFKFDRLGRVFLALHAAIIVYVLLGWLVPARVALYIYLLVLPLIVLQWVLNGGSSIINNFENLARNARWNDGGNCFEGALFQTFLKRIGVPASQGQITTVLCSLMLIFWLAALFRMILIVVPPPA
jgi:hypothetical protein